MPPWWLRRPMGSVKVVMPDLTRRTLFQETRESTDALPCPSCRRGRSAAYPERAKRYCSHSGERNIKRSFWVLSSLSLSRRPLRACSCHRAVENQPLAGTPKPGTPRGLIHISFLARCVQDRKKLFRLFVSVGGGRSWRVHCTSRVNSGLSALLADIKSLLHLSLPDIWENSFSISSPVIRSREAILASSASPRLVCETVFSGNAARVARKARILAKRTSSANSNRCSSGAPS
jgi:hypothetical protein